MSSRSPESFTVLPLLTHVYKRTGDSRGGVDPQNEIVSRLHKLARISRDGLEHYTDAVSGSQGDLSLLSSTGLIKWG